MNRRELFLNAMQRERYRDFGWVIRAFCMVEAAADENRAAYDIIQLPNGYMVVDPDDTTKTEKIDDAPVGEPVYWVGDEIVLKKGEIPNLHEDVTTTYGNVLLNYICILWPFGADKIPFMVGKIEPSKIEKIINDKWKAGSENDKERDPQQIYYDEYLKYTDAAMYVMQMTQVCVPAGSERSMTTDPAVYKRRAELLREFAGQLKDPAVIAKIEAELIQMDKNWIKGDVSEGYYISAKQYNIVRKKLFLHIGAEKGLVESNDVDAIHNSLDEGYRPEDFPVMNNTIRAGSLNRGLFTQYGGEAYKWLIRATANLTIDKDDCGSTMGVVRRLSGNSSRWLSRYVIDPNNKKAVLLNSENIKSYAGKTYTLRSPQYCHVAGTGYCRTCLGDLLSISETGLSGAISKAFGSEFLSQFLKSAHAKALLLEDIDLEEVII